MNTPKLIRWLAAALNLTASALVLSSTGGAFTENFGGMGTIRTMSPDGWIVG